VIRSVSTVICIVMEIRPQLYNLSILPIYTDRQTDRRNADRLGRISLTYLLPWRCRSTRQQPCCRSFPACSVFSVMKSLLNVHTHISLVTGKKKTMRCSGAVLISGHYYSVVSGGANLPLGRWQCRPFVQRPATEL